MIRISNHDAASLRRLLGRMQGVAGNDTKTKNMRRQAKILGKVLDRKINNDKR